MAETPARTASCASRPPILGRPDSRPGLPAIACPTLILAGRDDAVTPPELQLEMATLIPDATLVLLPRCGHLAPLERPEAVTRQLLAGSTAEPNRRKGCHPATTAEPMTERVLILDFGSQYTQLIARRVREHRVYCEIHPCTVGDAFVARLRARRRSSSPAAPPRPTRR